MLHGRILRSPYPHARIVRVDAAARARAASSSLTPDDVRELGRYGCQIKDQTVLAVDRARFAGDPVAAVAAETPEQAEEALALDRRRVRGAAGRARPRARRSTGAVARPRAAPDLGQRRRLLRDATRAGHERVPPLPDRPRRRERGLEEADGGRRGRRTERRPPSTRRWSRTPVSPRWDGERLERLDGDAYAVQRPRGRWPRVRSSRGAGARRLPADGRLVRREDVRPASRRSRPRSRGRPADRYASCCRAPRSG